MSVNAKRASKQASVLAAGTSVAATIPTANTVITAATGGVAFSILTICAVGLFWFDKSWILILYALFALLWQRELKTPALNEVDDLDTIRGIVGIASAVLIALTLIPLP